MKDQDRTGNKRKVKKGENTQLNEREDPSIHNPSTIT